jgi:Tol biopolymer transport system component
MFLERLIAGGIKMNMRFSTHFNFKRMSANILGIFAILAIALSAAGLALGTTSRAAQADELWWQDDFEGESLGPAWYWVNEEPAMWNLTENAGFLRIYTSPYATGSQNLLLRSPDADEFVLYTRVLFEPGTNFQFAGLVIWQDASNFLQFGRAFCYYEDAPCVGNGIYFDQIGGGTSVDGNFATTIADASEAFLRLERRGNTYWGYYSEEGSEWALIGVHQTLPGFTPTGIGLTSAQNFFSDAIPADFDYFAQGPTSDAPPRIVHRYHDYIVAEHFVPGALVTFTAYEFEGASEPVFKMSRYADETGGAGLQSWEYPVDLAPGNYLVVTDGSITKDLVLEPVTMDTFDAGADLLAGTAAVDEQLYVYVQNDGNYCYREPMAGPDGLWTADFTAQPNPCNVTDDMWTAAMVFDEDGDVSEATRPEPPTGYHDYDTGDVPSWACNVGGWAIDPDFPYEDVNVRILVDGTQVMDSLKAENYRPDLEEAWNNGGGGCPGGTCAFEVSLWDYVEHDVAHEVSVEAQDLRSGEWYPLNSTPKTLTCRTYDIYAYDPLTGAIKQITNLTNTDEYDPSWSPNGKKIAHDVVYLDGSHGIYITDVKAGISTPLEGAENGGNDAAWSPNGKWIAFDRRWYGEPNVYVVPDAGGVPTLIRSDAVTVNWGPNSKRVVFQQLSDGSIWTAPVDGGTGDATLIAPNGSEPAWSPDGNWIAYVAEGDIWKVPVNIQGKVLGDPIQVTYLSAWSIGGPTWSLDSQTIFFNGGALDNFDIWNVSAAGGEPVWSVGAPESGDYGPENARNSASIAYASNSPDGLAPRQWVAVYAYDPPVGTFDEGMHPYHFDFEWSVPEPGSWSGQGGEFVISDNAEIYDGYVLLRGPGEIHGVNYPDGLTCEQVGDIDPSQRTRFLIGWVPGVDEAIEMPYADARAHFESITATAVWDDGSAELARHEIIPLREDDWFNYVCTFTEAPPKIDLRVNYGHDWVESFYEAGHNVEITVTESDGVTVKATASVFTEPKDFWGGATGFQTTPENWSPAPPDLQPYDWVYAQVDNGVTAQVQLGDIRGEVRFDLDSVTGTIVAPWITDPVQVECLDWGSGQDPPFSNKDGGLRLTDGSDPYSCSWEGEWDVQPWQDIGVGYFTPEGHWVANAFRDERWMAFWTYDPPTQLFEPGEHSYIYQWAYSAPDSNNGISGPRTITIVRDPTPIYDGYALIGPWDYMPQQAWTSSACEVVEVLHPNQPMRFVWGWVNDYSMTYEEAFAHFESFTIEVLWDFFSDGETDGSAPLATMTELLPFTGRPSRLEYLCTLTEHP